MRMVSRSGASLALLALCCLALGATAARLAPDGSVITTPVNEFPVSSASSKGWLSLLRSSSMMSKGKGKEEEEYNDKGLHTRMMSIKFFVPPHISDKFEKEWAKMESKEGSNAHFMSLKASMQDNLMYHAYGEWERHSDLHDHLTSDHFNDFATWVDDSSITWDMDLLEDLSHEGRKLVLERRRSHEDEGAGDWDANVPEDYRHYIPDAYRPSDKHHHSKHGGRRHEMGAAALALMPNAGVGATDEQVEDALKHMSKRKEALHILIKYHVPPGMDADFVKEWGDCADSTAKEKGNHIYSLRRVATDNVHFYTYGTWDSWRDYNDHLESKHVRDLLDFLDDNDIVFFITPMETVG